MKVYIVQGESANVPGVHLTAHATKESAAEECASLVNILRGEARMPLTATAANWESSFRALHHRKPEWKDEALVWMSERDLRDIASAHPVSALIKNVKDIEADIAADLSEGPEGRAATGYDYDGLRECVTEFIANLKG